MKFGMPCLFTWCIWIFESIFPHNGRKFETISVKVFRKGTYLKTEHSSACSIACQVSPKFLEKALKILTRERESCSSLAGVKSIANSSLWYYSIQKKITLRPI